MKWADSRTRTGDPRITNALLYQLSHIGNIQRTPICLSGCKDTNKKRNHKTFLYKVIREKVLPTQLPTVENEDYKRYRLSSFIPCFSLLRRLDCLVMNKRDCRVRHRRLSGQGQGRVSRRNTCHRLRVSHGDRGDRRHSLPVRPRADRQGCRLDNARQGICASNS